MSTSPTAILQLIDTERDALRAFIVLLEREQHVLLSSDTDPLLELAKQKMHLAETLATSVRQRQTLFPAATAAIEPWLHQNAPTALTAWQDLRQLAAHAGQLNRSNGELIQIGQRYNQQALQALISSSQHAAGLYGPNGQPCTPGSGRTLGSG
ncbi:flagella synthesis protein FlgN [Ferrigenium sp. UT5]|uniref:flagella synthesis protein FlgN n=1 Tax=Ferrigenium sp. UT5 TaxID=3242105 RepID=UPI00354D6B95